MSIANRSMSGRGSADHLSAAANRSLRGPSPDHSVVLALQKELQEERTTVAALEKERDFYFGKLRDIEVLIQQESERNPDTADTPLLKEIQAVLYSTEVN
jgi:RP/EB family microtubule-associated protein